MENIFSQVIQAIEGEAITMQEVITADGTNVVKLRWFGPDLWVEKARRGRITAIECLALILFVEDDFLEPLDREKFVMAWANELKAAALNGKITPRNVETRLPLNHAPANFEWLLFTDDVDKFLHSKGLSWGCVEVIEHLYNQCLPRIERNLLVSLGLPEIGNVCNAATMPDTSASQSDKLPDWKESARLIADELFDHDTRMKCRDSLKGYSGRVMEEMQKRKIHGPNGPIANRNTIQRDALQGAAWWKHKKIAGTAGKTGNAITGYFPSMQNDAKSQ